MIVKLTGYKLSLFYAGAALVMLGAGVFIGWLTSSAVLTHALPSLSRIPVSSALAMLLYGLAVLLIAATAYLGWRAQQQVKEIKSVNEQLQDEIRARITTEAKLIELAAIVESSEDAIIGMTLEGMIMTWNLGARRMLGYAKQEIVGQSLATLMPENHEHELDYLLDKISKGETVERFETRRRKKNGQLIDVSLTVSPIFDKNGKLVGVSDIARDVTELKEAEKARHESEFRFRRLYDSHIIGILFCDEMGNITEANATFFELTGYNALDLPLTWDELTPYESRKFGNNIMEACQEAESALLVEKQLQRKDGVRIPVMLGMARLNQNRDAFMTFVLDISELKGMQQALAKSEEQFRTLFEVSPNGLLVTDENGNIILVNGKTEEYFGYSRQELLRQPVELLLPERYRPTHVAQRTGFVKQPRLRQLGEGPQLFGRHKTGKEFPVEIGLAPIRHRGGAGVLATITDITEYVKAQKALQEKTDALARSNCDLEQYAYVASHDLREPLRKVTNFTQLLARKYQSHLDETAERYIHYIVDGAHRMNNLIDALLDYSRVGNTALNLTRVDSQTLVARVISDLEISISEAEAEVVVGRLPRIVADRVQMRQVFQNLVSNAIKYRHECPPRVEISAESHSNEVIFSIKDNGIGIPSESRDRIFSVFQRLHPAVRYGGAGIGLAICKRIVEGHGGHIWVEANGKRGSIFRFSLPIEISSRDHEDERTETSPH